MDIQVISVQRLLPELLAPSLGRTRIVDARLVEAGSRCETWRVEAAPRRLFGSGAPEHLVLRVDAEERSDAPAERESRLVAAVRAGGVPAPEVLAAGDADGPLGRSWWVRRRLPATVTLAELADRPDLAAARAGIVGDCGRVLGQIHRLPPELVDDRTIAADEILDALGSVAAWPEPVREPVRRVLDQLAGRVPDRQVDAVVHGDPRPTALLADGGGLVAVLDWDACGLGDPASDLGLLCATTWRSSGAAAVAGLGDREVLRAAHRAESGIEVSPGDLWWWETAHSLRIAASLTDDATVEAAVTAIAAPPDRSADC